MAHRAAADLAYLDMVRELQPEVLYTRSTAALFSGFPIALLAAGVVAGAVLLAVLWKCCIRGLVFGKRAFTGHRTYHGLRMRDVAIVGPSGQVTHEQRPMPEYREERRGHSKDAAHVATIVGFWGIILFGVYAAFQVCGIDPAILVALGAVTILFTYGVAPMIQGIISALRVFTGGLLQEDDDIFVWAIGKAMRVYWMGTSYFIGEQIDDDGGLMEHVVSYNTLLNPGFTRYVDNGAKHTMGKMYTDFMARRQQQQQLQGDGDTGPSQPRPSSASVIAQMMHDAHLPVPRPQYHPPLVTGATASSILPSVLSFKQE